MGVQLNDCPTDPQRVPILGVFIPSNGGWQHAMGWSTIQQRMWCEVTRYRGVIGYYEVMGVPVMLSL